MVQPTKAGSMPAVRLLGAWIPGELDLDFTEIPYPLRLAACGFADVVRLYAAHTRQISLTDSHLVGLNASLARVEGHLRFPGSAVRGEVTLSGTRIAGDLRMDGATLLNPGGRVGSHD